MTFYKLIDFFWRQNNSQNAAVYLLGTVKWPDRSAILRRPFV
jgi:hypothetical protein